MYQLDLTTIKPFRYNLSHRNIYIPCNLILGLGFFGIEIQNVATIAKPMVRCHTIKKKPSNEYKKCWYLYEKTRPSADEIK
jgi:hypothetical protein